MRGVPGIGYGAAASRNTSGTLFGEKICGGAAFEVAVKFDPVAIGIVKIVIRTMLTTMSFRLWLENKWKCKYLDYSKTIMKSKRAAKSSFAIWL